MKIKSVSFLFFVAGVVCVSGFFVELKSQSLEDAKKLTLNEQHESASGIFRQQATLPKVIIGFFTARIC